MPRRLVYSNATLQHILKNKQVRLFDSLYGNLPEGNIGEKIHKLRMLNGLGLVAFGRRVGCSVSAIISWEDEGQVPSNKSIENICSSFGLDKGYFID
jgi:DNA-binding transcriptional regulator YiaG